MDGKSKKTTESDATEKSDSADSLEESIEDRKKRVFALTENERAELRYKRASAISFISIMLVFGIPLWWHTTSTYRVAFNNFAIDQRISIPIHVRLACWNRSLDALVERSSVQLADALRDLPQIERLDLNFKIHLIRLDSEAYLLGSTVDDGRFNAHIAIVDEASWRFSGKTNYFSGGSWAFVQSSDDEEKFVLRLLNVITDVLVDTGHLSAILRRDLKHRMDPLEVATLPPNQQKRLVWDSAALSAEYIVQVIFVHTDAHSTSHDYSPEEVLTNVRKFADKIADVAELKVSSEHLWDLDVSAWMRNDVQERQTIDMRGISSIITEVDHETSTVESSAPLLKLVVLDHRSPIVLLDQQGEDSGGVVIASWGAMSAYGSEKQASVSQSLIAALRVLLGLDTDLSYSSGRHPSPVADWELNRLKLRSFVDCSINGISSVQAIHKLIAHIDNIVINEEVAGRADRAVDFISRALETAAETGRIEVSWAVQGHALAQRAVNDQSLLALLYFPNDQKFAIYLPLFLPTLLPLFYSMLALYKYWAGKE